MKLVDPKTYDVILVGPICSEPLNAELLKKLKLIQSPQLAVDGGLKFSFKPYAWFGDGDSSAPPKPPIPAIWKQDQDQSDLQFCLKSIQGWEWDTLHAFGFLGDRKDHELSNIGTFFALFKNRKETLQVSLYDAENNLAAFILPAGVHEINLLGFFSILSLSPNTVSISGQCRYPANEILLEPFSGHGLSNEGTGIVVIKCSTAVLVFLNT